MRIMMILGWQSLLWEILTTIMTMTMTGLVMINLLSLVITGSVEGVGGHNQTIRDCPDIHSDHHRCHPDHHQCHCHLHHLRHRWQGGSMHKFRICLRIKWECMHPHLILKEMRPMKWHNVTQSWNQWFLNHVSQKIFTFCPTTTCAGSRTARGGWVGGGWNCHLRMKLQERKSALPLCYKYLVPLSDWEENGWWSKYFGGVDHFQPDSCPLTITNAIH